MGVMKTNGRHFRERDSTKQVFYFKFPCTLKSLARHLIEQAISGAALKDTAPDKTRLKKLTKQTIFTRFL